MGAAVTGDRRVPLIEAHRYEELLRRRALGESTEQLRRAFGLKSRKQVRDVISYRKRRFLDVCRTLGVEPPNRTPRPSTLTHGQVEQILRRYAGGELPKTIAPDFNISGRRVRDLISQHLGRVTHIRAQLAPKPPSGQYATWGAEEVGFLITHYPTDMALNAIARETRHHVYEVKRKAAGLGLPRSRTAPSLEAESGGPAFISANLEDVIGWLRANGYQRHQGQSGHDLMATGDTLNAFFPPDGFGPTSNYATIDFTAAPSPCYDFDDTTTETIYFKGLMPGQYDGTTGLEVVPHWKFSTFVGSQTCDWEWSFYRIADDADSIDSFTFATARTVLATEASATGELDYASILFTNAQADGIQPNEEYILRGVRDATGGTASPGRRRTSWGRGEAAIDVPQLWQRHRGQPCYLDRTGGA